MINSFTPISMITRPYGQLRAVASRLGMPLSLAIGAFTLLVSSVTLLAEGKAEDKWMKHEEGKLSHDRQIDGDSFGIELKGAKGKPITRTYRLYGADCPESNDSDKVLLPRIQEQSKWFGVQPAEIPRLGKKAAAFTEKLLKEGKPLVWTRGKLGQKTLKSANRPTRYYALVEVTAPDGKRRWLHELLIEAGLARAYGQSAPWPPQEEDRNGIRKAEEKFMGQLERLEKEAKRSGLGAWSKARP